MIILILAVTIISFGIILLRKRGLWDVKIGSFKVKTMVSFVVWPMIFFISGPIFTLVLLFFFVGIPWFCRLYRKKPQ